MPPTHCRWFRFSLRTLFVAVTVLACWLGYQFSWIRERRHLRVVLESVGGELLSGDEHKPAADEWQRFLPEEQKVRYGVPWSRRMLGDVPVVIVSAPLDRLSEQELDRIRRAFPEAVLAPMVAATGPPLPEAAEKFDLLKEVQDGIRDPLPDDYRHPAGPPAGSP
jgi:hypothetical protein